MLHASQVCLAKGFKKTEEMVETVPVLNQTWQNSKFNPCMLHASLVCIDRGFKKASI